MSRKWEIVRRNSKLKTLLLLIFVYKDTCQCEGRRRLRTETSYLTMNPLGFHDDHKFPNEWQAQNFWKFCYLLLTEGSCHQRVFCSIIFCKILQAFWLFVPSAVLRVCNKSPVQILTANSRKNQLNFVCLLTLRLLTSYIYGAPILDVSRSHTTTQHSRQDSSGRVISSSQRPLPDKTRHSQQTNIHAPGGIRTHDLSRWAAAGRSPAEIVGSNPTGGMDICLLWVSCVVR